MNTITLKCESCNSGLDISPEMNKFACGYCGVSQVVERKGGTVSLKLVSDAIKKVQIGTDKTAAELAIQRLNQELEETKQQYSTVRNKLLAKEKQINKDWTVIGIFCGALAFIFLVFITNSLILSITLAAVCSGLSYALGNKKRNKIASAKLELKQNEVNSLKEIKLKIQKNKQIVEM